MSNQLIEPGKTIGILGGGQLGRMMALSAREMGYKIAVLEPQKNSPCGQIADVEVVANYNDLQGAQELAAKCDVLTYEFENIDSQTARYLDENLYLPQGYKLLETTQHRLTEKKAIQELGLPVAPYVSVNVLIDLEQGVQELGLPAVLKTCRGGYDGKGQYVIKTESQVQEAYETLKASGELVLEKWITFEKELSVIVSRNVSGQVETFPVAENIHVNNILHQTIVPARIEAGIQGQAKEMAIRLASGLEMVGTLAVEMFYTSEGELYINELAPRPHNSGHYTMNACETSQFEQHIRAVCNWPLGNTTLLKPVVMVNILGEHLPQVLQKIDQFQDMKLHLYGKAEAKKGRKMGHINVLAHSIEEALEKINALEIW
ncbi:5-(carboxyamino)imidazole ribonucleotide synthase [Alkalihalobacterium chitinilyticum]|uniref:N5-carboxyaminoimidazole ribonucleotide synthase n=1 Tax=Alkalihalobacterium chitinilyticum TaxID=2980103 RepID=A0ABT5VIP8_9BACI|nr:5-(carboxyamino)imidazole ribonucleotide synthase [Alkalihalobacterium chitinilyticum]MDE5415187.1 5-(carboxyamino)imidazole ribonucleotide synthase [Alkalihalobacterium chitinilyticum]